MGISRIVEVRAPGDRDQLQREIRVAEEILAALRAEIASLGKDDCVEALHALAVENEHLRETLESRTSRMSEEVDTAYAALQDAVRASETDALTGLPNRLALSERMTHDIELAKRHGSSVAVLFLDLDGFKLVNDNFGHEVGDMVLQHVARSLRACVRASDIVCRLGGDEFVVVANDTPPETIGPLLVKVTEAVGTPVEAGGQILSIHASVGVSTFPGDGDKPEGLLRAADAAMYRAKHAGRRLPSDVPKRR